jgi:hypothetical protein
MALPIIQIDNSDGNASDTTCSGAGPGDGITAGTKLSGTNNVSPTASTTVTLPVGTDLTNVLTDGSHVLFINDTNAGRRNFSKIVGKDAVSSPPTVTVAVAFEADTNKSWAIGGKRQTIVGAIRLMNRDAANGDAAAGWTIRLGANHDETVTFSPTSTYITIYVVGDTTSGPFVIDGRNGNGPGAKLRWNTNANTYMIYMAKEAVHVYGLDIISGSGTNTSRIGFASGASTYACHVRHCKISGTTNRGMAFYSAPNYIEDCHIEDCTAGTAPTGIFTNNGDLYVRSCRIKNCTTGLTLSGSSNTVTGCVITGGTTGITASAYQGWTDISFNTITGQSGNGIALGWATGATSQRKFTVWNNIITNCGDYGIKWTNASPPTAAENLYRGALIRGNVFYGNANGNISLSGLDAGTIASDPSYANTGTGDYTPTAAAVIGDGWPASLGGVNNYPTPGAMQPAPAAGGVIVVEED